MKNKKLLSAAIIIAAAASFNASAKTEGNYVGLNLINTSTKSTVNATSHRDNNYSFGVDYKYAFNFNDFFIAPGIFYDKNASNSHFNTPAGYCNNIKSSYGIVADFGYDVTKNFSPFVTLGYSITHQTSGYDYVHNSSDRNEGLVYGFGLRYKLNHAFSVVAAYELTQFGLNNNIDGVIRGTDKVNSDYKVAKLGVAYHF